MARRLFSEPRGDLAHRGHQAWPEIALDPAVFAAYVTERSSGDASIDDLQIGDLYLACACARGDARAIAAFEASYMPDVAAALRRIDAAPAFVDEGRQRIRELLFTQRPKARPAILDFSGKASLRTWLRIVVTREGLRLRKRGGPVARSDDASLLDAAAPGEQPEIVFLKSRYAAPFRAAFAEALGALDTRQRNLLRQHFLDELGLERMARMYRVHRATVARWIAEARDELFDGTRARVLARVRLRKSEFSSLARLLESQLETSLPRLLAETRDAGQ